MSLLEKNGFMLLQYTVEALTCTFSSTCNIYAATTWLQRVKTEQVKRKRKTIEPYLSTKLVW